MTAPHTYITTTIPYVNARPHIGFALELVQADVLARYRRGRGDAVRFQAGTDDNSLKNVLAAEAAGVEVQEFVNHNAEAFVALGDALSLTVDDVIRTSRDPRHRPGVERCWRACSADLYRQRYEGLYCTGCEQFYAPAELRDGRCREHETVPQQVTEENWFFRSGPSRLRRTVSLTGSAPGSWLGPNGLGISRPGSGSTGCSVCCSRPVLCLAGCSRRSCLTRQRVSPFSARPAVTGDCRVLPRCSGGCR